MATPASAATIVSIVGSESIADGSTGGFVDTDSDGSLSGILGDRPDDFYEFNGNHNDFVTFTFTIDPGQTITSATINIDITDADTFVLTLYEGSGVTPGTGTLIGSTNPALGNQGSPGSWRAINYTSGGVLRTEGDTTSSGNLDYEIDVTSTLFANMESSGQLVLDGVWSGSAGVYGSNRAKLTITTIPEPATGALALIASGLLLRRRR